MSEPSPHDRPRSCDVAVIGGSAAGLAAALQVVRQRRSVIVVDDGTPRNAPATHMHGYLSRDGLPPSELTAIGRSEVIGYGGEFVTDRAVAVQLDGGLFRIDLAGGGRIAARRVLAATGLVDELPEIDGVAEHWGRDVLHCPFCHGYEVRDQRVVQIVTHPMGLHPTTLFRHLTEQLTIVVHDSTGVDEQHLATFAAAGVRVERQPAHRIVEDRDGGIEGVELADGSVIDADAVVVGPRFHVRAEIFAPAGLTTTPHLSGIGEVVEVDATGLTAVPGLYAAGNVTDPSMQVLHAAAHGSRVGAMIAFSLADEDLRR